MANMTGIQWTEETWNPVAGCSLVSPGCTNCYAMKQAARIVKMNPGSHYEGVVRGVKGNAVWTGKVVVAPDSIFLKPLRRKKPTLYFVNSMSDLFHEDIPDAVIDRVFAIMALRQDHRFQVLTKRQDRMLRYLTTSRDPVTWRVHFSVAAKFAFGRHIEELEWPLPNVWLGVSVEDQRRADERIPLLLQTPAAVRFLSVEPMLGSVDLTHIDHGAPPPFHTNALRGYYEGDTYTKIDWVICGGESGPKSRLFSLAWARALRDQCATAGVPFFMKQMGSKPVGNSFPFRHSKGGDMEEWPEDLRVRQMP